MVSHNVFQRNRILNLVATQCNWKGEVTMTTPGGNPSGSNPARPRGFQHQDAAAQANPQGGGQFTGGSEAKVIGVNQDQSATGAADATSGMAKQKAGLANAAGGPSQFTADD